LKQFIKNTQVDTCKNREKEAFNILRFFFTNGNVRMRNITAFFYYSIKKKIQEKNEQTQFWN